MSIQEKLEKYRVDLGIFDNNMDKYQYLITLGSKSSMDSEYRLDTFKVNGCMSQVWLVPKYNDNTITFMADSDAHITKGIVTMVADIFSEATKEEIQNTDIDVVIESLQLINILSPNRRNGAYNMFHKVKEYAK
jgi:cysteine desulfuration protein SufE